MAGEAKILQLIVRVVSVYNRIDYELDLSNLHASRVTNLVKYYLLNARWERTLPECSMHCKIYPLERKE